MKITVWGARGSIAVSGEQYLKYGGDTTCIEIETARGETVILDAGTGVRALGNKLLREDRRSIHFLFSHAHWDHLLGFPFFKPLYRDGTNIHFHGCTFAQQAIATILRETMRAPFFPINLDSAKATLQFGGTCLPEFDVAGLTCRSIPLSHPNFGYGFRLQEGNRSAVLIPDNELGFCHPGGRSFREYAEFASGADLLIHDAEYLPEEYEPSKRGWGHSTSVDTVRLGIEAGVKRLVLWHLNQDRADPQVDEMVLAAKGLIQKAGASIPCEFARTGLEIELR